MTPARRATSMTGSRSADSRMMLARCTCLSGRFRSSAIAVRRARSSDPTMTITVWAMPRAFQRSAGCESSVCVSALAGC